jgi:hypothetical protein
MAIDIGALIRRHVPQAAPSQIDAIVAAVAAAEPEVKPLPADTKIEGGTDVDLTPEQKALLARAEAAEKAEKEQTARFDKLNEMPVEKWTAEDKQWYATLVTDALKSLQQS